MTPYSRANFTFHSDRNVYVCPAGKLLTTTDSADAEHVASTAGVQFSGSNNQALSDSTSHLGSIAGGSIGQWGLQ